MDYLLGKRSYPNVLCENPSNSAKHGLNIENLLDNSKIPKFHCEFNGKL